MAMENYTFALSTLADMIIVLSFCAMIGMMIGNIMARIIFWLVEKTSAAIRRHKEKNSDKDLAR